MKLLLRPSNFNSEINENHENADTLETAVLHYLCVLVRDSHIREDIMPYMERIMELAFSQINSHEWKVR